MNGDDNFFVRSLNDRSVSSIDFYLTCTDMANRLREYRSKNHSLPKGNTLYRKLTEEILRLEERANIAMLNHLKKANENGKYMLKRPENVPQCYGC